MAALGALVLAGSALAACSSTSTPAVLLVGTYNLAHRGHPTSGLAVHPGVPAAHRSRL